MNLQTGTLLALLINFTFLASCTSVRTTSRPPEKIDPPVVKGGQYLQPPPDQGVYEMSAVEVEPSLSNSSDVQRAMERHYPPLLRDAGVAAHVTLRFRVEEDGRVEPATIEIADSTHEGFSEAARSVAKRMRFRPAKVNGYPVKVMVTFPMTFRLQS